MKKSFMTLLLVFVLALKGNAQDKQKFSLKEAVDYALVHSYANKKAEKDVKAAKHKVWETTTIGLPQISADLEYQNFLKIPRTGLPSAAFGEPPAGTPEIIAVEFGLQHALNANITLSQLLFDGSYLVGLQASKAFLKISESAKIKTEFAVKEAVTQAYASVLMTKENIKILERNQLSLAKNVRETKAMVSNGLIESQTAEQLELTLNDTENQLNRVRRFEKITYKMLNIAMGRPLESPLTVSDTFEDLIAISPENDLSQKTFVLNNNIDYLIAANNKRSQELLKKYEQSKALPTLGAFFNLGYNTFHSDFNSLVNEQPWYNSKLFGVKLSVPIFTAFGQRAKIKQAQLELEKADEDLKQVSDQTKLAHNQALTDYEFSLNNYDNTSRSLSLAERIENKEQVKFKEGLGTSFDLTNAQNQLYSKQYEQLQAMYEVVINKTKLENVLNIR